MIITLVEQEIKPFFTDNTDNIYFFEVDLSKLEMMPIKRYKTSKEYRITLKHKEITVCCPIYKDINKNSITYIPAHILPHRGYPVGVYLYAIALYLSSKLSMRDTATEVKKRFGLETFSHSTISRTLSRITENVHQITVMSNVSNEDFASSILRTDRLWDENKKNKYRKVLNLLQILLSNDDALSEGSKVSYDYFRRTKRYII